MPLKNPPGVGVSRFDDRADAEAVRVHDRAPGRSLGRERDAVDVERERGAVVGLDHVVPGAVVDCVRHRERLVVGAAEAPRRHRRAGVGHPQAELLGVRHAAVVEDHLPRRIRRRLEPRLDRAAGGSDRDARGDLGLDVVVEAVEQGGIVGVTGERARDAAGRVVDVRSVVGDLGVGGPQVGDLEVVEVQTRGGALDRRAATLPFCDPRDPHHGEWSSRVGGGQ